MATVEIQSRELGTKRFRRLLLQRALVLERQCAEKAILLLDLAISLFFFSKSSFFFEFFSAIQNGPFICPARPKPARP